MRLRITKHFRLILLVCMWPCSGKSQIEVSNAIDLGYPVVINNNNSRLNYGQISPGLRFGVSFKPTAVQFFPTLYFSLGRTRLPLKQFEDNVLSINMNYLNLLLNGNFVIVAGKKGNAVYLIGGIGFTRLNPKTLNISGKNGDAEQASLDSISSKNKVFPAVELGIEYVYGGAVNSNIYISMGLNFEYVYFFPERNIYHTTVEDLQHNYMSSNTSLDGHALVPTISLCLHYLIGKSIIFWRK